MNEKELEEKFEAFKKQLSETYEGKIKELSEKFEASEARNKELSAQNAELSMRLKKIEDAPNPRSLAGDAGDGHELELPPHAVIIEEDGTVRGV